VNNGTPGTYRDLKLRRLTATADSDSQVPIAVAGTASQTGDLLTASSTGIGFNNTFRILPNSNLYIANDRWSGGQTQSFIPTAGTRPRFICNQGSSLVALMTNPVDSLAVSPLGSYSTRTALVPGMCTSVLYGDNWFSASSRRAGHNTDYQAGGLSQSSWYFELGRVSDGSAGAFVVGNNHASATGDFQRQWYSYPGNFVFCGYTSTSDREQAAITASWADSTDATRTGQLSLGAYYTGTLCEGVRLKANSSNLTTTRVFGDLDMMGDSAGLLQNDTNRPYFKVRQKRHVPSSIALSVYNRDTDARLYNVISATSSGFGIGEGNVGDGVNVDCAMGFTDGCVFIDPAMLRFAQNNGGNQNQLRLSLGSYNGAATTFTWYTDRVADATWSNAPQLNFSSRKFVFQVGVAHTVGGQTAMTLDSDGSVAKLGFYGVTPVARAALAADATDLATAITLVNDLKAKLVALGLCS